MIWKIIAAPVIGAIIGYCTNWLAVKMLFRPREAKYIGKFHVPFTPGVIPKGKARLAKAVGEVVNNQLLTRESVEARLLSDEVRDMVRKAADGVISDLKDDDTKTVKQLTGSVLSDKQMDTALVKLENIIIERADQRIKSANLGQLVSDTITSKLTEAVSGSFIGKMMGDSMLSMVGPAIAKSVDSYVDENGETIIRKIVQEEMQSILDTPAEKILEHFDNAGINLSDMACDLYEDTVKKRAGDAISALDIGAIATAAIEDMDNLQLEELVLSTMKTELGAIVNLGALIGLLLGLINMIIYLI